MGSELNSRLHEGNEKLPEARRTPSGPFDLVDDIRDRSSVVVSSPAVTAFETALSEALKSWPKLKRIWLLRHFDFEKTPTGERYRFLSSKDKNELKDGESEELSTLNETIGIDLEDARGHSVLDAVLRTWTDSKISIFTDSSDKILKRNRQTLDVILGRFADKIAVLQAPLTPPKTGHLGESLVLSAEMIRELVETAKNSDWDAVLLWNRTFSPMFSVHADRIFTSPVEAIADFANVGYDYLDFDAETGKIVTKNDKKTLPLTPDNYLGTLRAILWAERAERYGTHALPLLQEVANRTLRTLSETDANAYEAALFELAKSDSGKGFGKGEIQAYAFERLMEAGTDAEKIDTVEWSDAAIGLISPSKHREFLIRYLWEKEDRPSSLPNLFARHARTKGGAEVLEDATRYWEIRQKQRRSVDPAIRSGIRDAIIPRKMIVTKPSETWTEKPDPEKGNLSLGYSDVFEKSRNSNIAVIGKTGEGKSIWLTEFAKWAIISGKRVNFIEAKHLKSEQLEQEGRLRKELENPNAILCVDAIDEMRDPLAKSKLQRLLDEIGRGCVITSRPSEADGFGVSTTHVWLLWMDEEKFLSTRIQDAATKRKVLDSLRQMRLNYGFHSNPLTLAFACLIQGESEIGMKTRMQFMEWIARFILTKHSKESKGQDFTEDDLDAWMDKLGTYAFEKHQWTGQFARNPSFDAHLSLLFKEGEDGAYDFVHASFYEYFLARHIAHKESPAEIIMKWRNAERILKGESSLMRRILWKPMLQTLESVIEILIHKREWMKITEIAHELITDPDDDATGSGFFMGLEILEKAAQSEGGSVFEEYKRSVYAELGHWNEAELAFRLPNLQTFLSRNDYPEIPEIEGHIVPMLLEWSWWQLKEMPKMKKKDSLDEKWNAMRTRRPQWGGGEASNKKSKPFDPRRRPPRNVEQEFKNMVLRYAENWALWTKTWLPTWADKSPITELRSIVVSFWSKSSVKEILPLLKRLNNPPDEKCKAFWNDYRMSLISSVAKAYWKFRIAGKMNPNDIPILLKEINRKNPKSLFAAIEDALSLMDPMVWKSSIFELLAAYVGSYPISRTPGQSSALSKTSTAHSEFTEKCASLLKRMGVSVEKLNFTDSLSENLEIINDLTGSSDAPKSAFSYKGAYEKFIPKQPDSSEIPKRPRFFKRPTENKLVEGEPEELFELINLCVESWNFSEAIRVSQCAYQFYGLKYA